MLAKPKLEQVVAQELDPSELSEEEITMTTLRPEVGGPSKNDLKLNLQEVLAVAVAVAVLLANADMKRDAPWYISPTRSFESPIRRRKTM